MKINKTIRLLAVVALSSTVVVGSSTAFAQEARRITTEGDVTFTEGGSDGEGVVVIPPTEPEEPGIIIPPVDPDPGNPEIPNTGPLTIAYVPTINFGERAISAQNQEYKALATEFDYYERDDEGNYLVDSEGNKIVADGKTPYVQFAQVQDTRGTNEGWHLTVSMTDFVTSADTVNKTIDGAQINFKSGALQNEGSAEHNAQIMEHLTLIPEQTATVMTADAGTGAGVQSIFWGNIESLETTEIEKEVEVEVEDEEGNITTEIQHVTDILIENPYVTLDVPGSSATDTTTYTTTLTWQLAATPGILGVN